LRRRAAIESFDYVILGAGYRLLAKFPAEAPAIGAYYPRHHFKHLTELPNLLLVGASAGYPNVPRVIGNGVDVVESLTKQSVWKAEKMDGVLV
jgi:hypothetical protein